MVAPKDHGTAPQGWFMVFRFDSRVKFGDHLGIKYGSLTTDNKALTSVKMMDSSSNLLSKIEGFSE